MIRLRFNKEMICLLVLLFMLDSCGPRRMRCGPRGICKDKSENKQNEISTLV